MAKQHICNNCEIDFKFKSHLVRHQNKKNPCVKKRNNNQNEIIQQNEPVLQAHNDNVKEGNTTGGNNFIKKLDSINALKKVCTGIVSDNMVNKILEYVYNCYDDDVTNNYIIIQNHNENINQNNDVIIQDNDQNILKKVPTKYQCKKCKIYFAFSQGLSKHKKVNKCIEINETIIDEKVFPVNIIENAAINNIVNNNNIVNGNINIYNSIYNTSPFGIENLDHIKHTDFKKIFTEWDRIIYNLGSKVYKENENNINFFKDNKNIKMISFLNESMEIKKLPQSEFKELYSKIILSWAIELLSIHKEKLSLNELSAFIKKLEFLNIQSKSSKDNTKLYSDFIDVVIDDVIRLADKSIIQKLKNTEKYYKNNLDEKKTLLKEHHNKSKQKLLRYNDYRNEPLATNTDPKCLYKLRMIERNNLKCIENNVE
jgi:hypothetical protein